MTRRLAKLLVLLAMALHPRRADAVDVAAAPDRGESAPRIGIDLPPRGIAAPAPSPGLPTVVPEDIPISGDPSPGMESFDRVIREILSRWNIPGAAVAVVKDGRLVYARGFGYSDVQAGEVTQPDSMFRIASLSKPITAAAIMKLVEDGRLSLDARAFDFLTNLSPLAGATPEPRLQGITIRNLLEHSGGWDRSVSFDPMFVPEWISSTLGVPMPPGPDDIIRFMKGMPLDFDPGSYYAYSNFGYAVLGRIIERVSGMGYEDFVRSEILAPLGVTRMSIGKTRLVHRMTGEVEYYDVPGTPLHISVFPDDTEPVPQPYGAFYLEALDSHGGWVASPIDYLRLIVGFDGLPSPPDFLAPATIAEMTARPSIPYWLYSPYWYAKGMMVRPISYSDSIWWHNGALPGTATIFVRSWNGLLWAVFYNSQPWSSDFAWEMDVRMWEAVGSVTSWPSEDRFSIYVPYQGPPTVPPSARVLSPNGGEKIPWSARLRIAWDASDDRAVHTQDVYLSTDGGRTYPVALARNVDYRSRSVDVELPPELKSHRARVRVVARDADGNEAADSSDADFSIGGHRGWTRDREREPGKR